MYSKSDHLKYGKYFRFIYSPRTSLSLEYQKSIFNFTIVDKYLNELTMSFDPFTIMYICINLERFVTNLQD